MKISKGATANVETKISKVQQKLGLKKTGKVGKPNSKVKGIEFKAEVKEILKKDILNIPKKTKQVAVSKESSETFKEVKLKKKQNTENLTKVAKKQQNDSKDSSKHVQRKKNKKGSIEIKDSKDSAAPKQKVVPKEFSLDAKLKVSKASEKVDKKLKKKNNVSKSTLVKQKTIKQSKASQDSSSDDDEDEVDNVRIVNEEKIVQEKKTVKENKKVTDSKPSIPDDTIVKALDVLDKLNLNFQKKKNELFIDEIPVLIQIDSIKIPKCTKRKLRLKLPHSLVTDTSDICLFVCDLKRGKKVDHEPTLQHYEDVLREKGVTNIKTIIPVRQIRVEYDQIEMKRRLLTQHDFFLTDARVSGLLSHKLGAIFFMKNQLPTPIRMDAKDLKKEIDRGLHKTVMRLHGEGTTFALRVGNGKQTPKQMCENIQAVLLQIAEQFPGGWDNVRSVHVKTQRSMAIPIYLTLKCQNVVKRPIVKPLYKTDDMVEGELSTVLGARVQVYSSGKVVVKRSKKNTDESDEESVPAKKPKLDTKKRATDSKKQKVSNNKENKSNGVQKENNDSDNESTEDDIEDSEENKDADSDDISEGSGDESDEVTDENSE